MPEIWRKVEIILDQTGLYHSIPWCLGTAAQIKMRRLEEERRVIFCGQKMRDKKAEKSGRGIRISTIIWRKMQVITRGDVIK